MSIGGHEYVVHLERFKLIIEIALLVVGILFAIIFAWRTWPYPAASLTLTETDRVMTQSSVDMVVINAALKLDDRSNFNVEALQRQCIVLDSGKTCQVECPNAERLLIGGTLSAGDGFSWTCLVSDAPKEGCVMVTMHVSGTAPKPVFGGSHWWSNIISCPDTHYG